MVYHAWHIWEEDRGVLDLVKIYDGHPDLFSIRLHFGGEFTDSPGRRYVGGTFKFIDALDCDLISVIELDDVIKELGLSKGNNMKYYFLKPDCGFDVGLVELRTDIDIHNLVQHVRHNKLIDVYVEQGIVPNVVRMPYLNVNDDRQPQNESAEEIPISQISQVENLVEISETHIQNCAKVVDLNQLDTEGIDLNQVDTEGIETSSGTLLNKLSVRRVCKGKAVIDLNVGDKGVMDDDEGSESDSEFIIDEDFGINDFDVVDMHHFEQHVDRTVEFIGPDPTSAGEDSHSKDDETNVINTEDLETDNECDEEMEAIRNRKIKSFRKQAGTGDDDGNFVKPIFYLGQTFSNAKEVKDLIKRHSVESRRELKMVKNDKDRVRTICIGKCPKFGPNGPKPATTDLDSPCPWTLHISRIKNQQTWQVKTYISDHNCLQSRTLKACTSEFLSHEILDTIQDNPQIPVKALQEQIQRKFELGVSKMKAFRAKAKAAMILKGDYTSQYAFLRNYCLELLRTNPGSIIKIETEDEPNPDSPTRKFKRVYICLGPLKEGFKAGLREILGLDGCFMKGPYPGQILTAVGIDGNNSIYPVAYALVEAETCSSWTWFLECIGDDLDLTTNSNFTFISDRQKGLIPALAKVFPCAEHRFCVRHIYENMKQKWRGKAYKELLWRCAKSTTVSEFESSMKKIRDLSPECANWLAQIPPHHWTKSHFTGRATCDVLINNLCEVFNRQLVDGRDKPILYALEYIREYLLKRIVNVRHVINKTLGPLTPTATKTLEAIKKEAVNYKVLWNGGSKYQVSGPWLDQCVVDTVEKECSCRKWELTGMPCKHVVAAIWNMSLNSQDVGLLESWVHKSYWLETWKTVYTFKVQPINGRHKWPQSQVPTTLIAPNINKLPGRPRKKRKKGEDEMELSSKTGKLPRGLKPITCGKCKKEGHNTRTCTAT